MLMAPRNPKSKLPLYAPTRCGSLFVGIADPVPPPCTCRRWGRDTCAQHRAREPREGAPVR